MDVGRGLGAPFKDPSWLTKALIGGVWAVVPFTGFALTGFYLDYIRNVAHGRETPLPEWNMFGRFWVRGLLASIAIFVFLLPAMLLLVLAFLPLVPVAMMTDSTGGSGGGLETVFAGGFCLAIIIATIYSIAVWIFVAAALTHYAMYEEFGKVFSLGEIKRRLSTPGASYGTALLMSIAIAIVTGIVSSTVTTVLLVIPVLGWIAGVFVGGAISFTGSLMAAHLFGQYAARAYGLPGPAGAPSGYEPPPSVAAPPTPPSAPPPPGAPTAPYAPEPPAPPRAPDQPPPSAVPPAGPGAPVAPTVPYAPEPPAPPAAPEPPAPPVEPPAEPGREDENGPGDDETGRPER